MCDALIVRPACREDFDEIACVWHLSVSRLDGFSTLQVSADQLRGRLNVEIGNGWQLLVAQAGAKICGFLAMHPEESMLYQIFVLPEKQGMGIGKTLIDKAKQLMPAGLSVRLAKSSEMAAAFYNKSGFHLESYGFHPQSGNAVVFYRWTP